MPQDKSAERQVFAELFAKSLGNVTATCNKLNITPTTYYRWRKKYPEFSDECDAVKNIALDFVESKFMKAIGEGNVIAMIFYLKCHGQARGYIERQQLDINDRKTLTVDWNLEGCTDDELRAIRDINKNRLKRLGELSTRTDT